MNCNSLGKIVFIVLWSLDFLIDTGQVVSANGKKVLAYYFIHFVTFKCLYEIMFEKFISYL